MSNFWKIGKSEELLIDLRLLIESFYDKQKYDYEWKDIKKVREMMRKKKWLVKLQRKLFLLLKFKIGIPENGHSLMNVLLSIKKKEFCKPVVRIV